MKKYIIYISILIGGLALGWLIFGGNSSEREYLEGHNASSNKDEIWTCSMHPQIRLPEPGDCPICGMDLIPLEGNSNANPLVFEMTEQAIKLANIQTTIINGSSAGSSTIKLSGKIKSDETRAASVVTHFAGRIEKLYVSFTGEKISSGQKIATIYAPKLISAQKELLEAYKVKETNPKLFEASTNKLRFMKITDNQIAAILNSQKIMESFPIYAGFGGVVSNKRVSVGDYVNEGEVLFDIQNLNELWAVFDLYESDINKVKLGDKIKFSAFASEDESYEAVVNFIDPVINPMTRTVSVRASMRNSRNKLKPEMFIEGEIIGTVSGSENVIVPKSAVLWTGEKSVVYVKVPNVDIPSFEFREVVLGKTTGPNYTVTQGLKIGEEVVTNGAFVIDASAQLNNQASMMNRSLVGKKPSEIINENDIAHAPKAFVMQLEKLIASYLLLKDALVQSDNLKAKQRADESLVFLAKIDMKLLNDNNSHKFWMSQNAIIKRKLANIAAEKSLKVQRSAFEGLSNALITSAKNFGVEQKVYYVQFCPMSNNGKGSHWLSKDEAIMNPYFGDEMLNCGSVKDTIRKDKSN
jgi:Cu(I)/Ag(I) efflux system membrane fusion protein